jgi:hypothetical protein
MRREGDRQGDEQKCSQHRLQRVSLATNSSLLRLELAGEELEEKLASCLLMNVWEGPSFVILLLSKMRKEGSGPPILPSILLGKAGASRAFGIGHVTKRVEANPRLPVFTFRSLVKDGASLKQNLICLALDPGQWPCPN